jgi:hypothetical protein
MKKNHKKTLYIEDMEDSDGTYFIRFNLLDGGLPIVVQKWAGIKNIIGEFAVAPYGRYDVECLADLNDGGKKFSTIADIIEKNVENL